MFQSAKNYCYTPWPFNMKVFYGGMGTSCDYCNKYCNIYKVVQRDASQVKIWGSRLFGLAGGQVTKEFNHFTQFSLLGLLMGPSGFC